MSNISVPATGAPAWWGGVPPGPYTGYTGRGVVIGIVSTGLDLAHADFRTAANQTRVKHLWDQTNNVGPGPAGFGYGTESTEAQINAGTVTQTDNASNGTFAAGVAAGNGRATGNGQPQYQYVGMAPEADLVIVKSDLTEGRVTDGVNYVFVKAAAIGKAAVVLVPQGGNQGAHDGSYSYDAALSALTGPGKIIVAPVGDQGGQALHAQVNLTATGQSVTINFSIPTYTPNVQIVEVLDVGGWHAPSALFNARLTSPTGYSTGWVVPTTASTPLQSPDGAFSIANDITTSSKGANQIRVYITETDTFPPKVGVWNLELERLAGATTGLFDAWIADWTFGSGGVSPVFTSQVSNSQLVMSPATGDSIISVGAFTTKIEWINAGNSTSFYYNPTPVIGAIATLSSPGPRRDDVQRPDVTAPGEGIAGAASASANPAIGNSAKTRDGVHVVRRGTYGAAAHVAGAVALLLQQYPTIEPSDMRVLLAHHSKSDVNTGTVPNATWGNGKLGLRPRCS